MEKSPKNSIDFKECEECQSSSNLNSIKFTRILLQNGEYCKTKKFQVICNKCKNTKNKRFEVCYFCNDCFEGQLEQASYYSSSIKLCLLCYNGNVCERCGEYCGATECDSCRSVHDYY